MRILFLIALVLGVVLLVGEFGVPECANYAGTARDSGYPCRLDRSSGASEYLLSKDLKIPVPFGNVLAFGLTIIGAGGLLLRR
jgi:hypothetical protein